MIRLKQTLTCVRDRMARFFPTRNARQPGFYQRPEHSFSSVRSASQYSAASILASRGSGRAPSAHRDSSRIPLNTVRSDPATVSIEQHAAHVCKFSHGSGLLVYVNGALTSAAYVALKVNLATLELVRRMPLDGLSVIGLCLAAAFKTDKGSIDVAWVEVDSETEREWRDAERTWINFSGGPYEAYEMEEHSNKSTLQHPICRFEEVERSRDQQRGAAYVAECMLRAEQLFEAPSDSSLGYEIELNAIPRPDDPSKTPSGFSNKENSSGSWCPGLGDGPIMSSEDFDALPEYSDIDVEDGFGLRRSRSYLEGVRARRAWGGAFWPI